MRDINMEVDMTTQVMEIAESIVQQVREEQDRFIFETITPYIEDMTKMVISKKILCRALQCFQEEHFEEYMALKKESEEEDIEPMYYPQVDGITPIVVAESEDKDAT